MTYEPSPIGEHIKSVATAKGISILELAIAARMAEPTLRRRLRGGGGDFNLAELEGIAAKLGTDIVTLLSDASAVA